MAFEDELKRAVAGRRYRTAIGAEIGGPMPVVKQGGIYSALAVLEELETASGDDKVERQLKQVRIALQEMLNHFSDLTKGNAAGIRGMDTRVGQLSESAADIAIMAIKEDYNHTLATLLTALIDSKHKEGGVHTGRAKLGLSVLKTAISTFVSICTGGSGGMLIASVESLGPGMNWLAVAMEQTAKAKAELDKITDGMDNNAQVMGPDGVAVGVRSDSDHGDKGWMHAAQLTFDAVSAIDEVADISGQVKKWLESPKKDKNLKGRFGFENKPKKKTTLLISHGAGGSSCLEHDLQVIACIVYVAMAKHMSLDKMQQSGALKARDNQMCTPLTALLMIIVIDIYSKLCETDVASYSHAIAEFEGVRGYSSHVTGNKHSCGSKSGRRLGALQAELAYQREVFVSDLQKETRYGELVTLVGDVNFRRLFVNPILAQCITNHGAAAYNEFEFNSYKVNAIRDRAKRKK